VLPEVSVLVVIEILKALEYAHARNLVHRDLKPENVLVRRDGRVFVADFGLAKRESSTLLTHRNVIAGTPAFMSPEQTLGKKLDAQCDLFSFGSVLRYAATGEAPFGKDDVDVVFHRIRTLNLEPLSKLRTDLDSSVCVAFDRLLIKDKSQRTESANRFLEEISGQDPVLKKKALTPLAWSVGLGIVCVVALGVGIGMFFLRSDPSRQPADGSVSSATSPLSRDFPFHIQGTDYRFQSLAEAIQMAKSGQEIVVSSDGPFACSQIAIGRKRISVVAGEGAHPKFTNSEDGFGRQFLITSSDLRLRGLEIDWLVDVELMDLQTMRELPAILCEDGKLELESCTVRRGMMGASVYGGRGMSIRDCLIEGGSHGISWLASGHELVVDNSTIRTKNGILVMFPPVASQPKDSGQCQLTNVRFECELAVEVALLRVQSKPISFESKGCTFDNPYLVGIMGAPPLARQIAKPVGMILMMRSSLVWNEENCVHQLEQMCVSSRLLKQTTQRNHGDVVGLSAWKREWNSDFAGSSESPRTETN
ncbi:MAG: protein kinase, partial [Pirellula sp.]